MKLIYWCAFLILCIGIVQAMTFETPASWHVVNQSGTSAYLSDGNSSIQIDVVTLDNLTTTNETWGGFRFGTVNCTAIDYYTHIKKVFAGEPLSGSTGGLPDPVSYAVFRTNFGITLASGKHLDYSNSQIAWYIAWRPAWYQNEFIGIHAVYHGLSMVDSNGGFKTEIGNYYIPASLVTILKTVQIQGS